MKVSTFATPRRTAPLMQVVPHALGVTPDAMILLYLGLSGLSASANLLLNPVFELQSEHWAEWQSELPEGVFGAHVVVPSGTHFSLSYAGPAVPVAQRGVSYRAEAFVRQVKPGSERRPVAIALRERSDSGQRVKVWQSPAVSLTRTFQRIHVAATPLNAGDALELYVLQDQATPGDSFVATYLSLTTSAPIITPAPFPSVLHTKSTEAFVDANGFAFRLNGTNLQPVWAGTSNTWSDGDPCVHQSPRPHAAPDCALLGPDAAEPGPERLR